MAVGLGQRIVTVQTLDADGKDLGTVRFHLDPSTFKMELETPVVCQDGRWQPVKPTCLWIRGHVTSADGMTL